MASYSDELQRLKQQLPVDSDIPEALVLELDSLTQAHPTSTELWLLKSVWIQLGDDGDLYSLDDARKCLLRAKEIEPLSSEPVEELGWFTNDIENNARDAIQYFERAIHLGGPSSCFAGLAKSLIEVEHFAEAEAILESAPDRGEEGVVDAWVDLETAVQSSAL